MLRSVKLALLTFLMVAAFGPANARVGEWGLLGSANLSTQDERAVIDVGGHPAHINKLQIRVWGRNVFVRALTVIFTNGDEQKIPVRQRIEAGGASPRFVLDSGNRHIRRIRLGYRIRQQFGQRRPLVEIYGLEGAQARPTPRPGPPRVAGDWTVSATKSLTTRDVSVVLNVGRDAGPLRKIKLRARGSTLFVRVIRIRFGNGEFQDVRIDGILADGEQTGPIDLDGGRRIVERLTVNLTPQQRRRTVRLQALTLRARPKRPVPRPPRGWKSLDFQTVDLRGDRFVMPVGRGEGSAARIRLSATGNPVFVRRMRIKFGNGEVQDVSVQQRLSNGVSTDVIDLNGRSRIIEHVVVFTRSQSRRRLARLELFGAAATRRPPVIAVPGGWVKFGSQPVSFRVERDTIHVGRAKGRFDRVVLRVRNNDVFFRSVRIVYGNGETQELRIGELVPADGRSRIFELRGDRFINQINMVYRSRPGFGGRAVVEVYGEYAEGWIEERDGRRPRDRRVRRGEWSALGAAGAQMFGRDFDTIAVGRKRGRFRAIKVKVLKHDVKIYALRVIFEDGSLAELPIRGRYRDGTFSQVFDLPLRRRRGRFIRVVQVEHQTKINFKGDGSTQIWGLR